MIDVLTCDGKWKVPLRRVLLCLKSGSGWKVS